MRTRFSQYLYPLIIFGQLIAGGTFPVAKIALDSFDPFTLAFTRFLIASIVMMVIARLLGQLRPIERSDWGKLLLIGFLAVPANQLLFLYGLKYTTAGRSALYYGATPVFVFLLALWYLKEKATWRKVAGIAISFAGVAIILRAGRFDADILFGDVLVILAVIAWAAYTILGKPLIQKYGALSMTAWALAIGTAQYLPFGVYFAVKFDYASVSFTGWAALLYIAILTSIIAYTIWYWALGKMEASKLAIFQNLQPVIAAILAVLLVGETLGLDFYLGGAMVILGVFLTQRG